jgi:diguanylate cyclase (GGDEF)-like protein
MGDDSAVEVLWLAEGDSAAHTAPGFAAGVPGWAVRQAEGLDAYAGSASAQALVVSLAGGEALAALQGWASLDEACAEAAVVVFCPHVDAEVALQLVQRGVQDVVAHAEAEALQTRLRWALERKRLEREARRAYATDLMTGLPNRQQFVEHMSQLIALRERENATANLLVLRIDGLAGIEAGHGPESANVVRRKIAVRLRANLRASDVVASLGADVFAVLLPSTTTLPDVQRVVIKLMRALREPFNVAGSAVGVTAHVGAAQYPQDGAQPEDLIRHGSHAALSKSYGQGGAANE